MRLLIIEDEEDLARAIAKGLRREGYAVDIVLDGQEGEALAHTNEYDLLILDLSLPSIDGLEICKRLRATQPALLILMLTARSNLHERVKGFDAGADDYLIKPFHFAELLARLRALLRRNIHTRELVLRNGGLRLESATRVASQDGRQLELTVKEVALLEYLLRHVGEVVSHQTLLEHVWDMNANPFTNAVRVHINSLRRKLNDNSRAPRYIETVIGGGYRMRMHRHEEGNE